MFSLFRVPLTKKLATPLCSSIHGVSVLLPSPKTSHHHHQEYHYKVNVGATETIKPSSPTPSNLTTFKLSLMDNQVAPIYVPFVFFFPPPPPDSKPAAGGEDRLEILKSSLAKTLTRFYPLAGRLTNGTGGSIPVVSCNDEGVPFSTATVAGDDYSSIARFLGERPEIDSLHQFLPFPADLVSTPEGLESAPQLAFRVTCFPCGGLVIGVCMFHKIVDGATLGDFMKLWSVVSRNGGKIEEAAAYAHNRAATLLLPARQDDVAVNAKFVNEEEGKIVTRRFVFDDEAINALKGKAKSEQVPRPSRSEAVAAFLWKSTLNVIGKTLSPDEVKEGSIRSIATMAVNLRGRLNEPWPDYSVGNIYWTALSFYDTKQLQHSSDETKPLQDLVGELRRSIVKIDKDFMEKLQGADGRDEFLRHQEIIWKTSFAMDGDKDGSRVIPFTISSLVGLKLYDVDFGWGKPVWVSMTTHTYEIKNMVALMESPMKNGVDAWLTLHEKEMTILEQDCEFLTYAKKNPSIM